jgi:hypothetical protein
LLEYVVLIHSVIQILFLNELHLPQELCVPIICSGKLNTASII